MSRLPAPLLDAVQTFAGAMAPVYLAPVAAAIADVPPGQWEQILQRAQSVAGGPTGREAVRRLVSR